MITLPRTALFAAIMLVLARAHWIKGQVSALAVMPDFRPIYIVQLLGNTLFLLPLPILLFLLYRSETTPAVSAGLRHLAVVTALVVGVVFTVPPLCGLTVALTRDLSNMGWLAETAVAPRLWAWITSGRAQSEFWSLVLQLSQIAVALFLIALVRDGRKLGQHVEQEPLLTRRAALVATIVAGIAVALNVFAQIRAAEAYANQLAQNLWLRGPTRLQFIAANVFSSGIPEICRMIPLIVYRSLSHPHDGRVEA